MNRLVRIGAGAALTLATTLGGSLLSVPAHATAGSTEGCVAVYPAVTDVQVNPNASGGTSACSYTATVDGTYSGVGYWTLTINHAGGGTETIEGNGVPVQSAPAAIKAGDVVIADALAPGGSIAVGNVPGA